MKCFKCEKGLAECGGLFRTNDKGEPGIFACAGCNNTPVDPIVKDIVSLISAPPEQVVYREVTKSLRNEVPYHPV